MPLLDACFEELRGRIGNESALRDRGEDPLYYLVFPPKRILEVKRKQKEWIAKLSLDGFDVDVFSAHEEIVAITREHPLRDFWLMGEKAAIVKEPEVLYGEVNKTIREVLISQDDQVGAFEQRLRDRLESLRSRKRPLLFITDLEAIHPYMRIGAFEQRLQGLIHAPVVVLYPGVRHGEFSLSFLGLYTVDGTYRSNHVDCQ